MLKFLLSRTPVTLTLFIRSKYRGINLSGPSNFQCWGKKTGAPTKKNEQKNQKQTKKPWCSYHLQFFGVNVTKCSFRVLRQTNVPWSKVLQQKFVSINRRKRTNPRYHTRQHRHRHDVDRWTWWSVNRSKPSPVDSLSFSDWFLSELLGRWSLNSLSKYSELDWQSESWTRWGKRSLIQHGFLALFLNTVFSLRVQELFPLKGKPLIINSSTSSHRRNTKMKYWSRTSFSFAGADVMVKTKNSRVLTPWVPEYFPLLCMLCARATSLQSIQKTDLCSFVYWQIPSIFGIFSPFPWLSHDKMLIKYSYF